MKHVVVTGGTGFIGSELCHYLTKNDFRVSVLTRSPEKSESSDKNLNYFGYDKADELVDGSDVVLNLAGFNLFDQRWTNDVKKKIISSRIDITKKMVDAILKAEKKPAAFLSASAVGYYGDSGDKELDETVAAGEDFLAEVCVLWEDASKPVADVGVRLVNPRIGIVIGEEGGALGKMITAFKMFVGGPLGDGSQYFPWIHMDDVCGSFLHLINNESISGPVNISAPNPVTMKDFAKALGNVMGRPSAFPVPEFMLRIAVGEAAGALTASLRAVPSKLLESGYSFSYSDPEKALEDILKK